MPRKRKAAASREEREKWFRLYDKDDKVLASGKAAQTQWKVGLTLCWHPPAEKEPRRISDEARFRGRRQRLEKRARKKTPLFAEQTVAEQLAARPAYYGLRTATPDAADRQQQGTKTETENDTGSAAA